MRAILTYHSIDPSGSPISVSEAEFRRHVRWLASGRVRVLPLHELAADPAGEDAVALTFDDGFESFGTIASPLLREHGLPATLFIVSDRVGGTNAWGGAYATDIPTLPLLDWTALGRVAEQGVDLGAHTRRHRALSVVRGQELEDEIVGCADEMQRRLGERPRAFAYPYGDVDEVSAELVGRVFALGCTTVLRGLRAGEDPALLPRLDMYYLRAPGRLESWGSPAFRRRLWLRAQARRVRQAVASARVGQ